MKTKVDTVTFSKDELDLLNEMTSVFVQFLASENEKVNKLMDYGYEVGEIAGSGEKYTENIRFWEVRDKVRKHLDEKKNAAFKLRNKAYLLK